MKKIIFAVTVFVYCLLISATGSAQETNNIPMAVKESFDSHFKNAEYKRWVQVKGAYVATFKEGQLWRDAYFTKEGEYKGIGRHISTELLPVFVQQTLSEQYPNFEVHELYQYECMQDGLCYYAILKNDKHQITLQLNPYGEITFAQKSKIKANAISTSSMAVNKD